MKKKTGNRSALHTAQKNLMQGMAFAAYKSWARTQIAERDENLKQLRYDNKRLAEELNKVRSDAHNLTSASFRSALRAEFEALEKREAARRGGRFNICHGEPDKEGA